MIEDRSVESRKQYRSDNLARREMGGRSSSVFPIPSREAVNSEGEDSQKQANIRVLGKSLAKQSLAIIPKIKELDTFLREHPKYKFRILESHPEVAFARMNRAVVKSRKKDIVGFIERGHILSYYLSAENLSGLREKAKTLGCNPDDIMDATCLAVTAALNAHGLCETIPPVPEMDRYGFLMKMTVPKKR